MCFNADTGKLLWEHRYNMFTSDVPPHRLAWASPVVDPSTGNVFAISGNGLTMSLQQRRQAAVGALARRRVRRCGRRTAGGCRRRSSTADKMIVSGLVVRVGTDTRRRAHRFIALDKTNGQTIWVSAPEGRPTDTIYANPYVADVNGVRMFFSGGSDGAMHALKIATGEPVWHWDVSKRGLNTAALMIGSDVIVTHSEENIASSEMGMIAAVPAASKGTLTDKDARWIVRDVQAGYGSPVSDGERIYFVDNGGILFAFDVEDGQAALDQEARHDPEVVAGSGGRQAVCRDGERQVLHHPAARGQSRGPRRAISSARRGIPSQSSPRRPSRAAASTSSRWRRCMRSGRRAQRVRLPRRFLRARRRRRLRHRCW